ERTARPAGGAQGLGVARALHRRLRVPVSAEERGLHPHHRVREGISQVGDGGAQLGRTAEQNSSEGHHSLRRTAGPQVRRSVGGP
ncbi:unnamed protein product, partial [Laminaria digitata]